MESELSKHTGGTGNDRTLSRLEWFELSHQLSLLAHLDQSKRNLENLRPGLSQSEIEKSWKRSTEMRTLIQSGYKLSIPELRDLEPLLNAISKCQLLAADELRDLWQFLDCLSELRKFCQMQSKPLPVLHDFFHRTTDHKDLIERFQKTFEPSGKIRDSASPEMTRVRNEIKHLRVQLEKSLTQLFDREDIAKYLQDRFWTVRSGRYVIPLRTDANARIVGMVVDTSDSGQTLFFEPSDLAKSNEKLLELDLDEKRETLRLLRLFAELLKTKDAELRSDYQQLVDFDELWAKGVLAETLNSNSLTFSEPGQGFSFLQAVHPLLLLRDGEESAVRNDLNFSAEQNILIISGPNAGGKSVLLKTLGLLQLMISAGLEVPVSRGSTASLFSQVFIEIGDDQNIVDHFSSFSGHLWHLKTILKSADKESLVLLDELCGGTDPAVGSALAQAILEELATRKVTVAVSTHFDPLKTLATDNPVFRNASMGFSSERHQPTYKIFYDLPGQSLGLEAAEKLGFDLDIVSRARDLLGSQGSEVGQLLSDLLKKRTEIEQLRGAVDKERSQIEGERLHWENQKSEIAIFRDQIRSHLVKEYETKFGEVLSELREAIDQLKVKQRQIESGTHDGAEVAGVVEAARETRKKSEEVFARLQMPAQSLPGKPILDNDELKTGDSVYILSLDCQGKVAQNISFSSQKSGAELAEVLVGSMRIQVPREGLRICGRSEKSSPLSYLSGRQKIKNSSGRSPSSGHGGGIERIDLRGSDEQTALTKLWKAIDTAILRKTPQLNIIHGHGENKLKEAIRSALAKESPYGELEFKPGESSDGGDGMTQIFLSH